VGVGGVVVGAVLLVVELVLVLEVVVWVGVGVEVMVPRPASRARLLLPVLGEEHGLPGPVVQHIQRGHLRRGQAVAVQLQVAEGLGIPEVAQRGEQAVGLLLLLLLLLVPLVVVEVVVVVVVVVVRGVEAPFGPSQGPQAGCASLGQAVQQQARLHALQLLGGLLAAGAVLVVGVVLEVLQTQTLRLLHEGPLVWGAQGLPCLAWPGEEQGSYNSLLYIHYYIIILYYIILYYYSFLFIFTSASIIVIS